MVRTWEEMQVRLSKIGYCYGREASLNALVGYALGLKDAKEKAPTPIKESRPVVDRGLADGCPSRSCGCYSCCRQYDSMYPKH